MVGAAREPPLRFLSDDEVSLVTILQRRNQNAVQNRIPFFINILHTDAGSSVEAPCLTLDISLRSLYILVRLTIKRGEACQPTPLLTR